MEGLLQYLALTAFGFLAINVSFARADDGNDQRNAYVVTPLVSDLKGAVPTRDLVLQNASKTSTKPLPGPATSSCFSGSCLA
jgi:hypothetical protein